MKKIGVGIVSLTLALLVGLAYSMPNAYAARKKVDCNAVMSELASGKKVKDVAADLKISTSSVYRCRRKEKMEHKHEAKMPEKGAAATASTHETRREKRMARREAAKEGMAKHLHHHKHHHAAPAASPAAQ